MTLKDLFSSDRIVIYFISILPYLDLDDIWNLRLVSKTFYSFVKLYKINQLVFDGGCSNRPRWDNWFSTSVPISIRKCIDTSKLSTMLTNPSANLDNLKCLRIKGCKRFEFDLNILNRFRQLIILEIKSSPVSDAYLKLSNLLALSIDFHGLDNETRIIIDTPNLRSLSVKCGIESYLIDQIRFEHPHTIRYLRLEEFEERALIFENLECLEVYVAFSISDSTILELLKEMKWLKVIKMNYCHLEVGDLNRLLALNKNMRLVLAGVEVDNVDKISEYNEIDHQLKFQIPNYNKLENGLNYVKKVDFNELIDLVGNKIPSDLFSKYTNIQRLVVSSNVKDEVLLSNFIERCLNLYSLHVNNSSLSQSFYNRLPSICSLTHLKIENCLTLNFKFIRKMKRLKFIITDQDLMLYKNLGLSYLDSCHLEEFEFRINGTIIKLFKAEEGGYRFIKVGKPHIGYKNIDELSGWFRHLRALKTKDNHM